MDASARAHWIATIFYHAERALLRRAAQEARFYKDGVADATIVKARQLAQYEQYAARILGEAHTAVIRDLHALIEQAVNDGRAAAALDLERLGYPPAIMPDQLRIIDRIVAELTDSLKPVPGRALRSARDAFQHVQAVASGQVTLGALTRMDASQWALDEFARRGITGFTDKAGRNWGPDTYAEMSVRTGAMNAAIDARLDMYAANGWDLVLVSDSPRECDLCRPWEYKVLTIGGRPGARTVESVTTGEPVTVDVKATIDQARAEGLFHPSCTHNATAFLPGATSTDYPKYDDPGLYDLTQTQRYYERQVRAWTLRQAAAVNPQARQSALAKLREWDTKLSTLIDNNSGLRRRPERENPFTAR